MLNLEFVHEKSDGIINTLLKSMWLRLQNTFQLTPTRNEVIVNVGDDLGNAYLSKLR